MDGHHVLKGVGEASRALELRKVPRSEVNHVQAPGVGGRDQANVVLPDVWVRLEYVPADPEVDFERLAASASVPPPDPSPDLRGRAMTISNVRLGLHQNPPRRGTWDTSAT